MALARRRRRRHRRAIELLSAILLVTSMSKGVTDTYGCAVCGLVPRQQGTKEGLAVLIFVFQVQRRVCFIRSHLKIDFDWELICKNSFRAEYAWME